MQWKSIAVGCRCLPCFSLVKSVSKGFGYKKRSSQFYKDIPAISDKICWSRSIKVSEIQPVVILWLLGCRQDLQPNTSLSLLTDEVTADVSVQEILSVLSEIAFNTWAPQLTLSPWESLHGARGLQTVIL